MTEAAPIARASAATHALVPSGTPSVEVVDLAKSFGETVAVAGVTFRVEPGEVFAFLGPNGAGKSTTINMLCTLARPTGGLARIAGFDVMTQANEVRHRIGLVFQEQTLDDQLTAVENLRFHAVLYGVPRAERTARIQRVLELVKLAERGHDLVSTFSGGMARRLEIARGMLHTPAVLFLDEPTIGLDPQTRALMWEDVSTMRAEEGVTVFLTTHYMDEAEIADRIAIIDHGAIVALGTPEELKAVIGADTVDLHTDDDDRAARLLAEAHYRVERVADGVRIFTAEGEAQVPTLLALLGGGVTSVHVHRPTLDDVFLHYTGRDIRESDGQPRPSMRQRARRARR